MKAIDAALALRGWLRKNQPAKSAELNVKDKSLFPALSKHADRQRRDPITGKPRILEGADLEAAVRRVWDALPAETIAKAYASVWDTAKDILAQPTPGQNEFLTKPGASHYGIRTRYTVVPNWGILVKPE